MQLVADLHIHSRYSRATSQDLSFPALHRAALQKGISIVGTGDFTHPGWRKQIEEQLVPAGEGLFKLEPSLARRAQEDLPAACGSAQVFFLLQVEISNIYKCAGRVRKNHNLVFMPSLDAARRFSDKLSAIGNLASDGRPILGLDARDLLETTLETDPLAFLVPAHIWTPWFSLLGSLSGFDSVQECFRDLTPHIFAAETGLSSDPAMNWRVSFLDRLTLISNSDAHSPSKLAREANLFSVDPSYPALLQALKTREGFLGTIEFFPEEGKYHLDGHRKCSVRLDPEETRALGGKCPACGGKLTVGVMSRVLELADRAQGVCPTGSRPFESLVGLSEIAGETLGVGPDSQKAQSLVRRLLAELGPELDLLRHAPLEDLRRVGGALVAEAVRRVRAGSLSISAGYDGEFGTVRIFSEQDRAQLSGQSQLLAPEAGPKPTDRRKTARNRKRSEPARAAQQEGLVLTPFNDPLAGLNDEQRAGVQAPAGPLLLVAGPGTGKTRTLLARIRYHLAVLGLEPEQILAITFTRQAAEEIRTRLRAEVPQGLGDRVLATTFHGFGLRLLQEFLGKAPTVLDDDQRLALALEVLGEKEGKRAAERFLERVSLAKQSSDPTPLLDKDPDLLAAYKRYEALLAERGHCDVDDLVLRALRLLRETGEILQTVQKRYRLVCVDEYQDVNDVQADLVKLLSPEGKTLCAIGDPEQAIYGFRGSRPGHFLRFAQTFPETTVVSLATTFRLSRPVLAAAKGVLGKSPPNKTLVRTRPLEALRDGPKVELVACPTAKAEAEQILLRLERILGGTSHFAVDSGRGGQAEHPDIGFGDVAVLVRTRAQRADVLEALGRSCVPCHEVGEDEPHDPRSQKVAILTMHASKGREFEVVFVAGVEAGLVPLALEGLEVDPAEERRLLYVAMTRARRLVVLSHCSQRVLFGRSLPAGPSPFLKGIPKEAVASLLASLPRASASKQLRLF